MGKILGYKMTSGMALVLLALGLGMFFYGTAMVISNWSESPSTWKEWYYLSWMLGHIFLSGTGLFFTIIGLVGRKK